MESPRDTINQILQKQTDMENQEKINISTWKKSTKFKGICRICKKEFEYEAIPKSQTEAKQWEGGWSLPERTFCSDKCKNVYIAKKRTAEFNNEWLNILPRKFRKIECDRSDLIKQGIDDSMFITGNVGVGKTVLMAGIAKEIIREYFDKYHNEAKDRGYISTRDKVYGVKWISYSGFIMELQSMFRKEGEETPFEMAEEVATYSGCLCIDDIGAEKMTAFVQQITYYIINYREQEMLHTLITSNFSLQQIDEQIDTRVSSRIGGMCKIIKLTGKDRRVNK